MEKIIPQIDNIKIELSLFINVCLKWKTLKIQRFFYLDKTNSCPMLISFELK